MAKRAGLPIRTGCSAIAMPLYRYTRLLARGKAPTQIVTAIGRELLGFIWAIGVHVERQGEGAARAAA